MGRRATLVLAVATAVCALAGPSGAQAKALHSPDSLAPPNAPAHWLPPEPWVYNHWLPYDEGRLYRLLGITRSDLWRQLRDDHRTLAQLAARHGWRSPRRLAAALVAPRRASVGARVAAGLEDRALRTITQGHLAQHVFFHSLHQFALPSAAPELFGVTDAAFRRLRQTELSPLDIARLHGRSPGYVEGQALAVLRGQVRQGVAEGAMSRRQAAILLQRQVTQLPRWLDQQRYNGPPVTHAEALVKKPRDYASNPAISADGRFVAFEAYRQKLPLAVKLGEIAVIRAAVDGGPLRLISASAPAGPQGPDPSSAYNATISGDGAQVAYESAKGNQNFAKRYGRIGTLLCDLHQERTGLVGPDGAAGPDSKSSYNPQLAADGRTLVYQAVRGGRGVIVRRELPGGEERVVVRSPAAGGSRYADAYELGLSGDGRRLVFTRASGSPATSRVVVVELDSGRATFIGPPGATGGTGYASDAAISRDGRVVVFTAAPRAGGTPRLYRRDLASGMTSRIPTGRGTPLDPVVSDGGSVVAFTLVRGARAQVLAWTAATGVVTVVSRADGVRGAVGDGRSEDPSISADGRRVAFASSATNLDPGKPGDTRGVFVRDLAAGTTRLLSDPAAAYEVGS